MPKYLYWGFVFVLFRESAPKIIRHYADMVRPVSCRMKTHDMMAIDQPTSPHQLTVPTLPQSTSPHDQAQGEKSRQNSTRIDYRPVLSNILNDYMFRCPTWRAAHLLQEKSLPTAPVYVFQFSHPTRVSKQAGGGWNVSFW